MPFHEVREFPIRVESQTAAHDLDIRFAHSLDGRTELIEQSVGPFAPAVGLGLHHVGGIAHEPLDHIVAAQQGFGAEVEWRLLMDGALFAVFLKPTAVRPVRVEVMVPFMSG